MEVKGCKKIFDYKYLLMFDLASRISGVCLWNITGHKPVKTYVLKVPVKDNVPMVASLYDTLENFFVLLKSEGINMSDVLISKEAMPAQLRGHFSTMQTFITLAKSHAIFDLYMYNHHFDVYDYIGVYPITTHAYFKKIQGLDHQQIIKKEDIRKYICDKYNITVSMLDESDAIFLAQTLVDWKWNKDLDELIKINRKHIKTLKSKSSQELYQNKILELEAFKNK